jgi:hypothetical protein
MTVKYMHSLTAMARAILKDCAAGLLESHKCVSSSSSSFGRRVESEIANDGHAGGAGNRFFPVWDGQKVRWGSNVSIISAKIHRVRIYEKGFGEKYYGEFVFALLRWW